ncbi:MAG TPA: glycosyltransferase family 4 protein [Anaerolineales bacterium]|nr:glycosyltransferase family 4 protein [Anaerolineales bacterium]
MKIGLVIYGSLDVVSGGYLYDRKLVEYLRAQGDAVEIISLPWRSYAAHLADNLRFRLPKALDILIEDELNHPSLIATNAARHPYPIISLVHHLRCSELRPRWQNNLYRRVEKKYLNSVDGFIFNSQTTRSVVSGLMVNEKPNIVAYPPTDRFGDAISENDIKARAKSNELRILFLGNVIYRKGLHTLLEAISSQQSAIRLDVVGGLTAEPAYAQKIQEFISANHLSSAVFLHSALDNQPLIEMYKQAHLMVVPSSYEGFGIVYLEGMGFGLPAIGTTAGAAGEIISDGVDGFLIQPGDSLELANRLKALNENRDLLIQMSLEARQRYLRQPKWVQTAGQIREFLVKRIADFSV